MINLRYDMREAYELGFVEHPQKEIKKLGIKFKNCDAFPIYDCWIFSECSNIPDELPKFLRPVNL